MTTDAENRSRLLISAEDQSSIDEGFFPLCDLEEPGPQEFIVDRLIPTGFITILFALGGSRKSFLALYIAFCIAMGRTVFGRRVTPGPVVFWDAELDRDTTSRRSYKLARGLGFEKPPKDVVYRRPAHGIIDDVELARLVAYNKRHGVVLTIIDSFSAGIPCTDINKTEEIAPRMKHLESTLGSILIIDHTSKANDKQGDATPLGAVAKINNSRSVILLTGTADGAVLKQTKANFDALTDPIGFALNFSTTMVCFEQIGFDDARIEEAASTIPSIARIEALFKAGRFDGGVDAQTVADLVDVKLKTAQNKLSILALRRVIEKQDGFWFPHSLEPFPATSIPRSLPLKEGGRGNGEPLGNPLGKREGNGRDRKSGRDAQVRGDE